MKNILFFLLLVTLTSLVQAQPVNNYLNNVIMPSPTAASLGKYVDIPVSYYTGVPNISLPIYTVSEAGLTIPVSLSYHASGVKVGEAPSWVGQNWSLSAGGMISRTVQGQKDEDAVWGWIYTDAIPEPPVHDELGVVESGDYCGFVNHYVQDQNDGEPDIFSFNFAGFGGKFYFKKNKEVVLVPMQDIKIIPEFSTNTAEVFHLKAFKIIVPDGTKYYFGDTGDGSPAHESNIGDGGNFPEISSGWYLKKVETADGKNAISLNYANEYSRTDYQPYRMVPCQSGSPGSNGGFQNIASASTFVKGKRITSIVSSTETVTFTPGAAREDLEVYPLAPFNNDPPKVLASITIGTGTYQRKFDLTYDYWVDNSIDQVTAPNTKLNKRLRLQKVQEKSIDGSIMNPEWSFEYFAKPGNANFMPHRISRSIDHWGFFNERSNGTFNTNEPNIPANLIGACIDGEDCSVHTFSYNGVSNRETNEAPMKYGTLKKIIYPTGGFTEFDFEANDFYSTSLPNDTLDLVYIDGAFGIGGFSCAAATFYATPQDYSFDQNTLNSLRYEWKLKPNTTNCQCQNGVTSLRVKVYNAATNVLVTQSAVVNMGCTPINGTSGVGNLSSFFPQALQAGVTYKFELVVTQGGASFKIRKPITNQSGNQKIGGLRVKQIRMHDGIATANDLIRTYEYKDQYITNKSSGVLYGKPNYVNSYSWFPCRNPEDCGSICAPDSCDLFEHQGGGCNISFFETSITPLSSFEGYHIGYAFVKELFNGNGTKTYLYATEEFDTPPQHPAPPVMARVLAGNLITAKTINSAGVTIASETHSEFYEPYSYSTEPMYKRLVDGCGFYVTPYKIRTRPYRESQVQNSIDNVTTAKVFGYDPQNRHLQKVTEEVTDADGTIYRTKYKYPLEYPCPSGNNCDESNGVDAEGKAVYALRKRYMIGLPIEQTTWLKRPSWAGFQLTSATYFQYDKVNTSYDNLKLQTVQQYRPATPQTVFVETGITSGDFSKSAFYNVEFNFKFSDSHGKLLSQWKQHDPAKEQYIWGHKNKMPMAKVINAEDNEVAFTSFEERNNAIPQGNWTLVGASGGWNTSAGNFKTGTTGFNLSPARTITKNVPAGKYIVSAWHKDGSFLVNGVTVSTSTGGQWKYAEREITIATPSNVTVSSGASDWGQYIDELRLYPSDALMQSFSFEENNLLMLSQTDENNVSSHYDFDVMQRLLDVRDQDRNIVQANEYNYHINGSVINDIKSRSVLTSGQTTLAQVLALSGANVKKVAQYMDGLGRPIQTLQPRSQKIPALHHCQQRGGIPNYRSCRSTHFRQHLGCWWIWIQ
jgi:hypothetical protein